VIAKHLINSLRFVCMLRIEFIRPDQTEDDGLLDDDDCLIELPAAVLVGVELHSSVA